MDQHTIKRAREAVERAKSATTPDEMIAGYIASYHALGDLLHAIEMEERVRSARKQVQP